MRDEEHFDLFHKGIIKLVRQEKVLGVRNVNKLPFIVEQNSLQNSLKTK